MAKSPSAAASRKTARAAARKLTATGSAKTQRPQATAADAVDEQLARYRSMRDFKVTAEPSGSAPTAAPAGSLPFCIQKHAASHLHYDVRLGWRGVLKSWACAKGPSYFVADKRLAVQVEDHPVEYGGFEGVIPAGQYGGGTVLLWDQGTWSPQPGYENVDAGLAEGHLKFRFHGTKLEGKFALIRMGGKAATERKPNWLLIKEHDEFERAAGDPAVTEAEPNSVVTGRSMEQIASAADHTWNSKETQTAQRTNGRAWQRNDVPAKKSAKKAAPKALEFEGLEDLPKEHQPDFLKPQLAEENETPPAGEHWLHELKLDGYRVQARKAGAKVQLLTRSGLDWTHRMGQIADEVALLPVEAATLDGEVVVLAADGTTSFAALQSSFENNVANPLTYFCFDLLHMNGRSTRGLPLLERKRLLGDVLAGHADEILKLSEHIAGSGEAMFHKSCELGAEGIVSKRADAPYTGGRSKTWRKAKCLHEQEFVIGGYTLPGKGKAGGPGLGALLLGFYDDAGKLIYAGRAGTGFTQKSAASMRQQLEAIKQAKCPFKSIATDAARGAVYVEPSLVAQIRFATWTADVQVRQAAFLGLREDKAAKDVRRELAAPTPKSSKSKERAAHLRGTSVSEEVSDDAVAAPPAHSSRGRGTQTVGVHAPVRLTHPAKILDAASKLTKQQLADFYWAVSERMLPHIAGRALSLVRLPNGVGKPSFYQKHVTATLPPGFDSVDVRDKKTGVVEPYIALSTREAIAALAQMAVMEVHPWGSRAHDLERPDRLVIDLDPDESLPWAVLTEAALEVRKRLKALGLESWVKTTGGKGLHVVFPIQPEHDWTAIKDFAHGFVSRMERANPKLYLTKMSKAARTGKIYLDYLRNERGATAVAPYSPRARENVGVAMPLAWTELKQVERPLFRVGNFADWQSRLKKDPWAGMLTANQKLTAEALRP